MTVVPAYHATRHTLMEEIREYIWRGVPSQSPSRGESQRREGGAQPGRASGWSLAHLGAPAEGHGIAGPRLEARAA